MQLTEARDETGIILGAIRQNDLLAGLPDHELNLLAPRIEVRRMAQGQIVHRPCDPVDAICFPLSGVLSCLADTGNGTSSEVSMIGREGASGHLAMFMSAAVNPWIVQVQVDLEAARIPLESFRQIADDVPVLRERCARNLEMLLFSISQTAACNARHSLGQRLSRWLLTCADRIGVDVVPLTHEFLANMLGVRRAGVTVTLNELQGEGFINATRGRIAISDRAGLERASCNCYAIQKGRLNCVNPGSSIA